MTTLYIFLVVEAVVLTAWIIYALNTKLELYCWINKKRVFCGYFDNLGDLNDYVYKLEAIHGDCLTDWIIKPVHKKKFVKQIDDKYFATLMYTNLVSDELINNNSFVKTMASMQRCIDRTKAILNEN